MFPLGLVASRTLPSRPDSATIARLASLIEQHRDDHALAQLEPFVTTDLPDPRALYLYGRALLAVGDASRAVLILERAAALDDSNPLFHLWISRAVTETARRGNVLQWALSAPRIRSEIERAMTLAPELIDARIDHIRFLVMAPRIFGGSVERAREEAEVIMGQSPAQGHFARGYIEYREKRFAIAQREFIEARRLDPRAIETMYWLGWLYQETMQWDAAFAILEQLVASYPVETRGYYEIARTSMFSGLRLDSGAEGAQRYLRAVSRRDTTGRAAVHYVLGSIRATQGKTSEAIRELETAIALDPRLTEAKVALERLRRVQRKLR